MTFNIYYFLKWFLAFLRREKMSRFVLNCDCWFIIIKRVTVISLLETHPGSCPWFILAILHSSPSLPALTADTAVTAAPGEGVVWQDARHNWGSSVPLLLSPEQYELHLGRPLLNDNFHAALTAGQCHQFCQSVQKILPSIESVNKGRNWSLL